MRIFCRKSAIPSRERLPPLVLVSRGGTVPTACSLRERPFFLRSLVEAEPQAVYYSDVSGLSNIEQMPLYPLVILSLNMRTNWCCGHNDIVQ